MERKIRLLNADEIEVRINQVKPNGATALLYKTARVDYEILDETFGIGNWQVDYQEIKGNLFCTISIWDEEKKTWVRKQNCGVESRADGNGNEKKGEASDAIKRAGTVVGIGRELYTSPFIWLRVNTAEKNGKHYIAKEDGKPSFDSYCVSEIGYDEKRRINKLVIVNQQSGEVVYSFGLKSSDKGKNKAKTETKAEPEKKSEPVQKAEPQAQVTTGATVPGFDSKTAYNAFISKHGLTLEQFTAMRDKAAQDANTGVVKKPFKSLTEQEWQELLTALEKLVLDGYFKEDT